MTRRQLLSALFGLAATAAVGCRLDRNNLNVFGYTTEPPFDDNVRSVYIPTFKLTALVTSEHRGIDVHMTEALVKELASRKCPIRVVSDKARADTELIGNIVRVQKNIFSRTQQNLTLEGEMIVAVEVLWRDLRTGDVLTNVQPKETPVVAMPFDPNAPPPPPKPPNDNVRTVTITATGRYLVPLGESNATAADTASTRIARQIVNMMEKPWSAK